MPTGSFSWWFPLVSCLSKAVVRQNETAEHWFDESSVFDWFGETSLFNGLSRNFRPHRTLTPALWALNRETTGGYDLVQATARHRNVLKSGRLNRQSKTHGSRKSLSARYVNSAADEGKAAFEERLEKIAKATRACDQSKPKSQKASWELSEPSH
jgi:hypothetical protein